MRVLAMVLAFVLTPGVAEASEDLAHYVAAGHTLHEAGTAQDADDSAEHRDSEHGCSTLFHVCGCHSPAPSMTTSQQVFDTRLAPIDATRVGFQEEARRPRDGVAGDSFRPPIN